jgi:2'-5' RNA ligase
MRYYLHIPLPAELRNRVSKIEKKFQGDSRPEPHITLVFPRQILPRKLVHELAGNIHKAAKATSPFEIILEGRVRYFGEKDHFYIPIKRTEAIVACHQALVRAVGDVLAPADGVFADMPVPHITLASKVPEDRRSAAWSELRNRNFSGSFMCKKVILLRFGEGDKKWEVVATFPLGNK